ncbi:MAG: hypothetical protein IKE74_02995 [Mogibacterium sp.]|nr:hypothetical protein [Mogibacterium sp.]
MDKVRFYNILDIESPDEFKFYENLSALLEEDEFIEENLIKDLLRDIDKEKLAEHFDSYFEAFLGHLPENETEMYMTVDSIGRVFDGMIYDGMSDEDISALASEISKFRKWYVHDLNVFDRISGSELSVRDARYDIAAAKLLGDEADHDFRLALDYDPDGYNVRVADMLSAGMADEDIAEDCQ